MITKRWSPLVFTAALIAAAATANCGGDTTSGTGGTGGTTTTTTTTTATATSTSTG